MTDCLWPMFDGVLPSDWAALDVPRQTVARTLASRTLERLTAGRVGVCPVTVRPCRQLHRIGCGAYDPTLAWQPGYPTMPMLFNGRWSNGSMCTGGCSSQCELPLPAPIGRVDEVKVNGAVVNPANYAVADDAVLVWVGGGDCPWPIRQDMSLPTSAQGTMSVTYVNAYPPGEDGIYAASMLAWEFAQALSGNDCRLPDGVSNIVRQGITMTIPTGAFPGGLTGIREVDTWVAMWNPHALDDAPQVWSPDMPSSRRY